MHALVGILGLALLGLMGAEFFSVFLLPRRVKRDPRIARGLLRTLWRPWRSYASRLSPQMADTLLGVFGPLGLLTILGVLSVGTILGFSAIHWALSTHLAPGHGHDYGDFLYFSAGAFASTTTPTVPVSGLGKALQILEAANGIGFAAIAIGYLPALFQAFSRRETAVSRLDPRAGTPPTPAALLLRTAQRGGWSELDQYLREWETWTAELMETHLSYPILGYFRSQHVGQNWLAALTTVVDACAYAIAYGPEDAIDAAELTFRIGRHALADLAFAFDRHTARRELGPGDRQRLTPEMLLDLRAQLEDSGLHSPGREDSEQRLDELRRSYEHYALAIASELRLALPDWLEPDGVKEYWRAHPVKRSPAH